MKAKEGLKVAKRVATKKAAKESGVALSDVKLSAPVTNPNKVIAIGLNYLDHIREQRPNAENSDHVHQVHDLYYW